MSCSSWRTQTLNQLEGLVFIRGECSDRKTCYLDVWRDSLTGRHQHRRNNIHQLLHGQERNNTRARDSILPYSKKALTLTYWQNVRSVICASQTFTKKITQKKKIVSHRPQWDSALGLTLSAITPHKSLRIKSTGESKK